MAFLSDTLPRVYLAGPDIFYPDQDARYAWLEALCVKHGLRGIRPSDGGIHADEHLAPDARASRIYQGNVAHLQSADALLVNLEPFRGAVEPDSGTVFELGMAVALCKPVALYLEQAGGSLADRIRAEWGAWPKDNDAGEGAGPAYDARYRMMIEDFGLPLNLMLAVPALCIESSPEAAAACLAAHLRRR